MVALALYIAAGLGAIFSWLMAFLMVFFLVFILTGHAI